MPDPRRETISASQVAALWDVSPYLTRWMLYHWATDRTLDLDDPENVRMEMGNRFELAILDMAQDALRLDVTPNEYQTYERHASIRLGCTVDAAAHDPNLGPGVVEAKNVDSLIWRSAWSEDAAPKHIELQLQAQMLVLGATWGCIAALVGGNRFVLYRRQPDKRLWRSISTQVEAFWSDVEAGREPSPTGMSRELRLLDHLYPEVEPSKVIHMDDDHDAAEVVEAYAVARRDHREAGKEAENLRSIIGRMVEDAQYLYVPGFEVSRRDKLVKEQRCPKCNHKLAEARRDVTYKTRKVAL